MKIKYPSLFKDEILEAILVEAPSFYSSETALILEIVEKFIQIEPPGDNFIIITATEEDLISLKNAGYEFSN